MTVAWPEEKIAVLKQMWADGASGDKIGVALDISRNAVLAKVRRLDLPMRAPGRSHPGIRGKIPANKGGSPQAARAAAVAVSALSRKPVITLAAVDAKSPAQAKETMGGTGDDCSFGNRGVWPPQGGASSSRALNDISAEQVVTAGESARTHFLDLRFGQCKYPLWKNGAALADKFCCGARSGDDVYCGRHRLICTGVGTPGERSALQGVAA